MPRTPASASRAEGQAAAFEGEVFEVDVFQLKRLPDVHSHIVVHHQLGELMTVDEDDSRRHALRIVPGLVTEFRGRDEHALGGAFAMEGAKELLHVRSTDGRLPRLGLNVDQIETESVLPNHAVHTFIASVSPQPFD